MRKIYDRYTANQSTPQVNNAKSTKTKSTHNKKIPFKYTSALLPNSSFRILSHRVSPDSTLNGCNSTGKQDTSNRTLKRCIVELSIENNGNDAIAVGKAVNALMKLIHGIEGDTTKFKISPCESNQPNLEVIKYIKGEK